MTLTSAFPSCPGHPPRYEIAVKREDGAFILHTFASIYPAKKFFDILIGDREWKWVSRRRIICEDLEIRSTHLERYVTHEFTPNELVWQLPEPYCCYAHTIAFKTTYTGAKLALGYDTASKSKQSTHGATLSASPAFKRQTSRRKRTNERNTTSNTGKTRSPQSGVATFGIDELSTELRIPPTKVRQLLRARMTKPQEGWCWPLEKKPEILKVLG